jgi:hypothetical protein
MQSSKKLKGKNEKKLFFLQKNKLISELENL